MYSDIFRFINPNSIPSGFYPLSLIGGASSYTQGHVVLGQPRFDPVSGCISTETVASHHVYVGLTLVSAGFIVLYRFSRGGASATRQPLICRVGHEQTRWDLILSINLAVSSTISLLLAYS